MKIVIAPNAFKGSLSATAAAEAMRLGLGRATGDAEAVLVPVADGGDGLVDVLADAMSGELHQVSVKDPLFRDVNASFCYLPEKNVAVIEMAKASGLALLSSEEQDPTRTTTLGTGELITAALQLGAEHVIVGIGGSATIDGGVGMACALGFRFLDGNGEPVRPVGGELIHIRRIENSSIHLPIEDVLFEAVCDVDNPLLGPEGAASVYGPQKGATPEQVDQLEQGLGNLADVIKKDLGIEVRNLRGGGAAGGLGAGLFAFSGARLKPGMDLVLDLVRLDSALEGADLVLTAEGRLDSQTAFGKAPAGVAARAKARGIPCLAIAGSIELDLQSLHAIGIDAAFSICHGPITLEQAMTDADTLIAACTEQAVRAFLAR